MGNMCLSICWVTLYNFAGNYASVFLFRSSCRPATQLNIQNRKKCPISFTLTTDPASFNQDFGDTKLSGSWQLVIWWYQDLSHHNEFDKSIHVTNWGQVQRTSP